MLIIVNRRSRLRFNTSLRRRQVRRPVRRRGPDRLLPLHRWARASFCGKWRRLRFLVVDTLEKDLHCRRSSCAFYKRSLPPCHERRAFHTPAHVSPPHKERQETIRRGYGVWPTSLLRDAEPIWIRLSFDWRSPRTHTAVEGQRKARIWLGGTRTQRLYSPWGQSPSFFQCRRNIWSTAIVAWVPSVDPPNPH